jgi:NTP pyrophosphatase (non-canonical NTP hydrolase)
MMLMTEYETRAMSFRKPSANGMYALLNLSGEVGELHSLLAKALRDGPKEDMEEQLLKECGDILWCLVAVLQDNGFTLEDAARKNIEKLSSRKARGTLDGSGDNR